MAKEIGQTVGTYNEESRDCYGKIERNVRLEPDHTWENM